jgi:hypothetical protein
MGSCSTGISQNVPPMDFISSTSTFTQRGDSSNRGINWTVFDQHRLFSAKEKMFATQASVSQYRPRNSGGNIIMSVAPGTKPEPRWSPIGLSHTKKRRVQRLQALEIREEMTQKKLEEWFNRGINWTVFDQHRLFSDKEKMFALQASVSQYRPRNSGGNIIVSVLNQNLGGVR